jgi:hypothetical protein
MTAMSDYLEGQLVNHLFRTGTYTKPTVLAIALCTAAVTDTHTGALTGAEVGNAGSYARLSGAGTTNPLDANWAAASTGNGTTSNLQTLTFTAATADWGTVTHVAITDNLTYGAGNVLFYGSLTTSKIVNNGDTFQFAVGQLSIQLDN